MQSHLLRLPQVDAKIVLHAFTNLAFWRLRQYGSIWIIKSFSVYNPLRRLSSDPYQHLWGLPTILLAPQLDLPQRRKIGYPSDPDFSWKYYHASNTTEY